MPPTSVPSLYRGSPPGSADRPSGEGLGPIVVPAVDWMTSEQMSCENCTPESGPPGWLNSCGLKCDCTIWFAVRVEKALPAEDRYAPVTALATAALGDGTMLTPSRPPIAGVPLVIVNVAAAPVIAKIPSTLPTRSTTAMVAGAFRAFASATACAITVVTSPIVSAFGVGITALLLPFPAPPPQPASNASATAHTTAHAVARAEATLIAACRSREAPHRRARPSPHCRAR